MSRTAFTTVTRTPEMLKIAATIDRYGINIVHVGDSCDCADCSMSAPTLEQHFGYTIGLTELGQPELLVRDMDSSEAAALLNRWGDVVLGGTTLDAGHLLCEGPGGSTWELVPVRRPARVLRWASMYYGSDELSALELIPARRPCRCATCG